MKLILIITFLFSLKAHAYTEDMALKGGVSLAHIELEAFDNSTNSLFSPGFNTSFGYKWDQWEVMIYSHINVSKTNDFSMEHAGNKIFSTGTYRNVQIAPMIKYTTNTTYKKFYHLYFAIGPAWGLQSFELDEFRFLSGSNIYNNEQKLTYESFGGNIAIGFEENTPYKEMHPIFLEILYSYKKSRETSLIDISDTKEVQLINKEEQSGRDIHSHTIMINFGITLF